MLGILFPGQGSQYQGMGKFLFEQFPMVKPMFEEASDAIKLDLKKLCFTGSEETLGLTENTQPAIVLISYMTYQVLTSIVDLPIHSFAGHSVGEYSALAATQAISFSDAITLVRKRGQTMQTAVPAGEGAMMAVVGPSPSQVAELCLWANTNNPKAAVSPANYNSPEQTVISGSAETILWIKDHISTMQFKEKPRRLQVVPLKVSAPFHCPMMLTSEESMREVLVNTSFRNSNFPIVQNYSAKPETKAEELRENLIRQISNPVRWTECIAEFKTNKIKTFLELGPGKVLTRLNKKIDKELVSYSVNSLEELKKVESLTF